MVLNYDPVFKICAVIFLYFIFNFRAKIVHRRQKSTQQNN